jgi:hypothetical protein
MRLVPDLRFRIDQLRDKSWSSGLSNPLQSLGQISCLIINRPEGMDLFKQRGQAKKLPYRSIFGKKEDC